MFHPLKSLADHRRRASVASSCRRRRAAWFKELVADLPRPVRILDVGGDEAFWTSTGLVHEPGLDITVLNRRAFASHHANLRSLAGDVRNLHRFDDRAFDVVFSNSTIEHVGDECEQRQMALELRRVGKRYFVQTPNRWFPIEPHFLVPGFQFLPIAARIWLATHFRLGWYDRFEDRYRAEHEVRSIHLLSRRRLHSLFPDAAIRTERLLGAPKSFVAVRQ